MRQVRHGAAIALLAGLTVAITACGGSEPDPDPVDSSEASSSVPFADTPDFVVCEDIDLHGTQIINNLDVGDRDDAILERAMLDLETALQDRGEVTEDVDEAAQSLYETIVRLDASPANVDTDGGEDLRLGVRLVADVCTELGFYFDGD